MDTDFTVIMVPGSDSRPTEGVSRHVYEISKRLASKGIKVLGIKPSLSGTRLTRIENYLLFEVPSIYFSLIYQGLANKISVLQQFLYYLSYKEAAKKLLDSLSKSPIILHTHGFYALSQTMISSNTVKRLCTFHGSIPLDIAFRENKWSYKAKSLLYLLREVYSYADHYTVFVEPVKKIFAELYGIDSQLIDVVPHGVDARFFREDPEPEEIRSIEKKYRIDKPYRILFLGHLARRKNPEIMLKAMKILSSKRKDTMMIIASRWGDYYLEAMNIIRKLNLESIVRIISDPIFGKKFIALYKISTVFISLDAIPSTYSTALLEAMASGIPPIIFEHSGNRYVVDESTGFILRSLDPYELADLINYIIEDEEKRREKGKNAQTKVSTQYDWDRAVIPRYMKVYNKLLAKS
jgi:glycosyltransferase involved in cell wall biosynthesis